MMQIMTAKSTSLPTLYVYLILNIAFSYKFYDIVLSAGHFPPAFFPSITLMFPATAKCNVDRWMTGVISTSTA